MACSVLTGDKGGVQPTAERLAGPEMVMESPADHRSSRVAMKEVSG